MGLTEQINNLKKFMPRTKAEMIKGQKESASLRGEAGHGTYSDITSILVVTALHDTAQENNDNYFMDYVGKAYIQTLSNCTIPIRDVITSDGFLNAMIHNYKQGDSSKTLDILSSIENMNGNRHIVMDDITEYMQLNALHHY